MNTRRWVPVLLPPLLVVTGCGGGASGEGAEPVDPATSAQHRPPPPTGPVVRWDPDEHGVLAVAQRWADEGGYVQELEAILDGSDPRGERMRRNLRDLEDPVRRPEVVQELLDYYDKAGHPGLAGVLRDFPREVAQVLVELSDDRPEFAMRMADKLLFVGGEPIEEAWSYAPLRTTVARLCVRSQFDVTDVNTGPARVWALRVAGRARLKEAKDGILLAAGYGRRDDGQRLPADPYGPAASMARKIIRERMRRKK